MELIEFLDGNMLISKVSREISIERNIFQVIDYKVKARIDETIYEKNQEIWEKLPRGLAIIKQKNEIIRIVCGLRKFGYENDFKINLGCEELVEEIYINKVNGEYCSVSSFNFDNNFYFVIRSKNVSILLSESNYVQNLNIYNEDRYFFAIEMAKTFWQIYNDLNNNQKDKIKKITEKSTINLEFCSLSKQHLVEYNSQTLYPFAITSYLPSKHGLTYLSPEESFELFKEMGFANIPYFHKININDHNQRELIRENIYNENNSEGAVVYQICINKLNIKKVCQVYKFKNYKYIFWRAVREKIRNKCNINQLRQRLENLHIVVPEIQTLISEAINFYAYFWSQVDEENYGENLEKWVYHFKNFKLMDQNSMKIHLDKFVEFDKNKNQLQIMTIGLPGSGKSTLLKSLQKILPQCRRINQDECQKSSKIYHKNISKLSKDKNCKVLLMDKCYHNKNVRENTLKMINLQNLLYIIFYHPEDVNLSLLPNSLKLVKQRIINRGLAHLNLFPSAKLDNILNGFIESIEHLDNEEDNISIGKIYLDITLGKLEMINLILEELEKLNLINFNKPDVTTLKKILHEIEVENQKLAQSNRKQTKKV